MHKSNLKNNGDTTLSAAIDSLVKRFWSSFIVQGSFLRAGKDLGHSPVIERLFDSHTRMRKLYLIRDGVYAALDIAHWLAKGDVSKSRWAGYFFRRPTYRLWLSAGPTIRRNASILLSAAKVYRIVVSDQRPLHELLNIKPMHEPNPQDLITAWAYGDCMCAIPYWFMEILAYLPGHNTQVAAIWFFGYAFIYDAWGKVAFLAGVLILLVSGVVAIVFYSIRYVCRRWRVCDRIRNMLKSIYSTSGFSLGSSGAFSLSLGSFFYPVTRSVRTWPLSIILNKHLGDYPTPANLSYFWSFGSLAGLCLGVQLVTGIILAMHYVANAELAFASVEHIMRDVNGGWLMRYLHANGASFFFIAVYIHIARAIFYRSYVSNSLAWSSGVLIFFLLMATAFIGYVLPWGQMSYWGATVITNLFSAIPGVGVQLVWWLWGGFSVSNATLNRFFSLHYLLPMVIAVVALLHLFFLHGAGSSNPLGVNHSDKLPFFPYFVLKDVIGFFIFAFVFLFFVFYFPNVLGHFDNYIEANPFITPMHIVPEWYFLPFYAILRSIPNKLGGVLCMGIAIVILAVLPFIDATRLLISPRFSYFANNSFWLFALATMLLGWLGGVPVEFPFVIAGQISTLVYFSFFGVLLPTIVVLEFYVLSLKTRFLD